MNSGLTQPSGTVAYDNMFFDTPEPERSHWESHRSWAHD
jgi:hypothetical protein